MMKLIVLAGGLITVAFLSTGIAHADETILSGGLHGGDCVGYAKQLADTGQLPAHWECAAYSSQNSGFVPSDTVTMVDSVNQGAQVAYDIYRNTPKNQQITFRGMSEGAIVVRTVGQRIIDETGGLPGNVNLVSDGDPGGSTGLFTSSPLIKNPVVEPVVDSRGLVTNMPNPPITRNFHDDDPFADGATKDPATLVTEVAVSLGAHEVQNPADPHVTWAGPNNEINNEYGVGVTPVQEAVVDPPLDVLAALLPPGVLPPVPADFPAS